MLSGAWRATNSVGAAFRPRSDVSKFTAASRSKDRSYSASCLILLSLFFLSSCGTTPDGSDNVPRQQASTENLNGARVHTELAANYYSRRQFDVALEELGIALRVYSN